MMRYYPLNKYSPYGGHLRHRHDGDLDKATALHWLLHDRCGAAMLARVDLPAGDVANLLVRAAAMKREEVTKMESTTRILKNVQQMGEAEYTRLVTNYAKSLYPTLSEELAFTKVFCGTDAESIAIRAAWQIAKGGSLAVDPDDDADRDDDDDADAMAELERLAAAERKRTGMSKARAFAKVYTDPENAKLAAAERRANRPRA
jgi:hypothetical protein